MSRLLLHNGVLIDGTGADPRAGTSVLVEDGHIRKIGPKDVVGRPAGARVIDLGGMTLMPGLTDAHVHFGWVGISRLLPPPSDPAGDSLAAYVLDILENAALALHEGFTTVRDAGGLDPVFAELTAKGFMKGPRILPSASFLSQTGGHGDQRSRYDGELPRAIPGLYAAPCLCDGVDAVRGATREQLRKGATQIKVMASGGAMSPTDLLESLQFTVEEMAAIVHEAWATGKYVMAHCHTSEAMESALDAGVRSIEHASILEERTAHRMAQQGTFMVPTLLVAEVLHRKADDLGVPEFSRQKLARVMTLAHEAVQLAWESGVAVASGSDLLGTRQSGRAEELALKAKLIGPMGAIVSATQTNARLFGLDDGIGTVEEGKEADLIAVAGSPLDDIALLKDASNVRLVLKAGDVVKETP